MIKKEGMSKERKMAISCAARQAERRKMKKVEERDGEGKVSEKAICKR